MKEHVTLMQADEGASSSLALSSGLPADLLAQAADRLRVLALLYAFAFFTAGVLPALALPVERERFVENPLMWAPSIIGIAMALLVAALIRSPRLSLPAAMNLGLVFEVVSSYAIAAAEFGDPVALDTHEGILGLSWVAVWVVLFTVVVPTSPRRALLTALASVSSVPVIVGAHRRDQQHHPQGERAAVLLRAGVPLPHRRGHGLYRRAGDLPARSRSEAGSGAGELSAGGEAGRGRHGRGLARAAPDAGQAGRDQADPAIVHRGWARRRVGGGGAALRARGAGDRPASVAPHGGSLRFRRRDRRRPSTTSWNCWRDSTSMR